MTVIAWDGKTLAGDKRSSFGGLHAITQKLHRVNGMLIGGCGSATLIQDMLQWFRDGADHAKFPATNRDAEKCAAMLVVKPDGTYDHYESGPNPLIILNPFWAIGSGRDFAMAAMYLGKTAREAVELTCILDSGCGNGVDTLELE